MQPQCGRAVGFSSGSENPHGVKAVTKGQRCAIALWFTLDPRHSERVSTSAYSSTVIPYPLWKQGVAGSDVSSGLQERVQADDLVKMLFRVEEVDLLQETGTEQEPPPVTTTDGLHAARRDEL